MTACTKDIKSHREFLDFIGTRPCSMDATHIQSVGETIKTRGTVFSSRFGSVEAHVTGTNYREDIHVMGSSIRSFAMLDLLDQHLGYAPYADVYCMEGLTPFARTIQSIFPNAVCSEYAPDPKDQKRIAPIPHVDAMDMFFEDNSFDAIISGDVFEHVPDLNKVFKECQRVLRQNGVLIATFPFACVDTETIVKATLADGEITHHMEPEYHGDPVRPNEGALVFQIPAWDVIDQCYQAGFSKAEMVYMHDPDRGFIANNMDGLFVLRAMQ